MGIYEKMPETFLTSLDRVFQFTSPRKHGHDAVAAIKAMHAEPGKVFIALGGNFVAATPDTLFTAKAIRNCRLTVQISTKLNRSHIVTGKRALILPCLGRSEQDLDHEGQLQCVTVEDSMSVVHASKGRLKPASLWLKSEPEIIARMALATLKNHESASHTPWEKFIRNHALIRDHIEKVLPDFHDYNARVTDTRGFTLPNHAALRQWKLLPGGKATFISNPLSRVEAAHDQLILQTLRSHDQFNTTIYGLNDRYRGISNERRVVFLNPEDMRSRGISPLQRVNLTSHWSDGTREARNFLAIPYDTPRGSAAAYFPEANVLVPVDSKADLSHTPTSKAVMITVAPIA